MGGSHSHDDDPDWSLPPALRKYVLWIVVPLVVATLAGMVLLWPKGETPSLGTVEYASGRVTQIKDCTPQQPDCQVVVVEVVDGPGVGEVTELNLQSGEGAPLVEVGSEVWLTASDFEGAASYAFADIKRDQPLLLLVLMFAAAVVLLSRWKGVAALAGLAVSMLLLAFFLLPALVQGGPPVAIAAVGASAIAMATMGLAHGFTMRTGVALIGTIIALLLTAFLGAVFTTAARFTGVGGEDAFYLQNSPVALSIDLRGLFLAGLVIGALGGARRRHRDPGRGGLGGAASAPEQFLAGSLRCGDASRPRPRRGHREHLGARLHRRVTAAVPDPGHVRYATVEDPDQRVHRPGDRQIHGRQPGADRGGADHHVRRGVDPDPAAVGPSARAGHTPA